LCKYDDGSAVAMLRRGACPANRWSCGLEFMLGLKLERGGAGNVNARYTNPSRKEPMTLYLWCGIWSKPAFVPKLENVRWENVEACPFLTLRWTHMELCGCGAGHRPRHVGFHAGVLGQGELERDPHRQHPCAGRPRARGQGGGQGLWEAGNPPPPPLFPPRGQPVTGMITGGQCSFKN